MIKINNKNIIIPRGDTASAQFSIYTTTGEPFILPNTLIKPCIMFAVAKKINSLKLSDELLIAKYYAIAGYDNKYKKFSQDILSFTDAGGVFDNLEDATTEAPCHVYRKYDGTYVYFATADDAASGTETEYKFIITILFDMDDTMNLPAGTYKYNMALLDISSDFEHMEYEWNTTDLEELAELLNAVVKKHTLIDVNDFTISEASYI